MKDSIQLQEEAKTSEEFAKKVDDQQLSDVTGGGDGWWGRDEAPDGHDIGCWTDFSYYQTADDYCANANGRHEYSEKVGGIQNDFLKKTPYQVYKCKYCSKEIRHYISED